MDPNAIDEVDFNNLKWVEYDIIFLASGFEARSTYMFQKIPETAHQNCVVLGFHPKKNILSRSDNDNRFEECNIRYAIHSRPEQYEEFIKINLERVAQQAGNRTLRIFIDYSVMTRVWYAYILTWLRYADATQSADVDFAYAHGTYEGEFSSFQIDETRALAGFEGAMAGTRRTVALYGLGYDKYATLAVHEIIQPDSFLCYMAEDDENDGPAKFVAKENSQIIELSGHPPLVLPLSDLGVIVEKLKKLVDDVSESDEVMAVAMGPKTHILGTLLVGHQRERLTCIHSVGERNTPVQVIPAGRVSCWRIRYR